MPSLYTFLNTLQAGSSILTLRDRVDLPRICIPFYICSPFWTVEGSSPDPDDAASAGKSRKLESGEISNLDSGWRDSESVVEYRGRRNGML